jgi:hypothetical protein
MTWISSQKVRNSASHSPLRVSVPYADKTLRISAISRISLEAPSGELGAVNILDPRHDVEFSVLSYAASVCSR